MQPDQAQAAGASEDEVLRGAGSQRDKESKLRARGNHRILWLEESRPLNKGAISTEGLRL